MASTDPSTMPDNGTNPQDLAEKAEESARPSQGGSGTDSEDGSKEAGAWDWNKDPAHPYNWPAGTKAMQIAICGSIAFLASLGTSIMSSAPPQLKVEFGVTTTQAILPLSVYVFALALGPVIGGPLSETVGRLPVYIGGLIGGGFFTLGAALVHNFVGLNILRFLAGLFFAPSLAIGAGTINELYRPQERGLPATVFILTPFLGPGFAPIMGAFITHRKGWRWTQWTMLFFLAFCLLLIIPFGRETFHPVLKQRRAKELNQPLPPPAPRRNQLKTFATISVLRPIVMIFTEPIVGLVCLYVACEFSTLFSFFAAVPFIFEHVYHFSSEQSGLVFVSVVVGCLLGSLTVMLCEVLLYRPQIPRHPPHMVPPEHRLYPAMIGSLGLPVALFWMAWTSRPEVHWISPALAIVPFAWGNLCVFISLVQYTVDTYSGSVVASAVAANSLTRYALAGAFPLFTIQMYTNLGIAWATSLLGFIAVVLLPVPWVFYKFGKKIRSYSRYETPTY